MILLNTVYNTLHTVFSTKAFNGCRALAHLIAPLYTCYSSILSTSSTPEQEPYRIISGSALKELRSIFFSLCNDDRLLVRREAARELSACFQAFGGDYLAHFINQISSFVDDDVEHSISSLLEFNSASLDPFIFCFLSICLSVH